MSYQITLSDEDYAALAAVAAQRGTPVETLVHEVILECFGNPPRSEHRSDYELPTGESDSPEEEAEDERLAASISSAKPWVSEMVIDDRGPR